MNELRKARIVLVDGEASYSCLPSDGLNRLGYGGIAMSRVRMVLLRRCFPLHT
jgi:hypothetical protein